MFSWFVLCFLLLFNSSLLSITNLSKKRNKSSAKFIRFLISFDCDHSPLSNLPCSYCEPVEGAAVQMHDFVG